MRRTLILLLASGVMGMGLGCHGTCQHTAGVCDCDPPCVETALSPYHGLTPAGGVHVAAPLTTVPTTMPHTAEPLN